MGNRRRIGRDVMSEAVARMERVYRAGHRVVVSFSAGKDSGVCLEICIIAATNTGRLPVEVVMRDEEIMFPGTFEYAERMAQRPEIQFYWLIAHQPIVNVFNRANPYWWVFDPLLKPEQWVRQPPPFAQEIAELDITRMIAPHRFPPDSGKLLITVIGLRTQESPRRAMGLMSSGGYLTKPSAAGVALCRPVYDWSHGDVWRAIRENKWDYNSAYDVMLRHGVNVQEMRIAPPTLTTAGVPALAMARKAWPRWFDRVETRLPGIKTVAQFGLRAVRPNRRLHETWEACFWRECVEAAPAPWLAERARFVAETVIRNHNRHATSAFPEKGKCMVCKVHLRSWEQMAKTLYNGDPFAMRTAGICVPIEPDFFRPGAGQWGGKPTW